MLKSLSIQNIVLIDTLNLDFAQGLTVMTGETGAGKSIVLDALGLILGDRGNNDLIREGAASAVVTATFALPPESVAVGLLENAGLVLSEDRDVVCRRVLQRDRTSRAFVNDQPVTQNFLKELGQSLVHIHGQFDAALTATQQRDCVDRFGVSPQYLEAVREAFGAFRAARQALEDAHQAQKTARERAAYLSLVVQELGEAKPQAGEETTLMEERAVLGQSGKIVEALGDTLAALGNQHGSRDEGGLPKLLLAHRALQKIAGFGKDFAEWAQRTETALRDLEDVAAEARHRIDVLESQHHRLGDIDDRLHRLRSLARKYGCPADDMAAFLDSAQTEWHHLTHLEEHLETLEHACEHKRNAYCSQAKALTDARTAAGRTLAAAIMAEFPALKLEHARITIDVTPLPEAQWSAHGVDAVHFRVATNESTHGGSLATIASGGERSRIELALRAHLAAAMETPTLIFDEVDSGMGGAVAAAVGQRLQVLSQRMQILAITHSPQVAACGTAHYHVSKRTTLDGAASGVATRPTTHVVRLDDAARVEELARMLSGSSLTEEARAAAKTLFLSSRTPVPPAESLLPQLARAEG